MPGSRAALLALALLAAASSGLAREDPPQPPAPTLAPRPISDSIEPVVERIEAEHESPCQRSRALGIPCFSVQLKVGPVYSVKDSLLQWRADGRKGSGRGPVRDPLGPPSSHGPSPTIVPLITFDPGCTLKSALKSVKGRNDTYYLYRLRDGRGSRIELHDRKLDATTVQGDLELLGEFHGECDAIAAYRREERGGGEPAASPPPPSLP